MITKVNSANSTGYASLNSDVKAVFEAYPKEVKEKLLYLRELILETATSIEATGEIEETLKWGEISYLTPKTKSGSTVRIGWKEAKPEQYSIYFKCTANLVLTFKEKYPNEFKYGTTRSIDFQMDEAVPVKKLKSCIAMALTYHLNKTLEPSARWQMVEEFH